MTDFIQVAFEVLTSILFLSNSLFLSIYFMSFSVMELFCMISAILANIFENLILSSSIEKSIPMALLILIMESTLSFLWDLIISSITLSFYFYMTQNSIFLTFQNSYQFINFSLVIPSQMVKSLTTKLIRPFLSYMTKYLSCQVYLSVIVYFNCVNCERINLQRYHINFTQQLDEGEDDSLFAVDGKNEGLLFVYIWLGRYLTTGNGLQESTFQRSLFSDMLHFFRFKVLVSLRSRSPMLLSYGLLSLRFMTFLQSQSSRSREFQTMARQLVVQKGRSGLNC